MCAKGINDFQRKMSRLGKDIEKVISDTVMEFMRKILAEAMASLPAESSHLKSSFKIEKEKTGDVYRVSIFSDEELAAYVEFGTGIWARAYLSGQPKEVVDEAIKFYINGKGTTFARPYLFPAYYRYLPFMERELDARVQLLFDRL
ncbi:HK97 gp10 family phage protein [Sphingobacterium sp. SGG-5]|uniref:HK97 gp10 family phage protein n=1 Tax=Sphingobacterium sp. SGG-5 TaxID=2710881 RepID=UPI0013EB1B50|nr:HK97 gp10 family phage protein [Sphingobacterium sp. SGG-5]NGM63504.1 HK97 gp10 family phage protein [Sphingobacterium sp. SGG-5]